MSGHPAFSPRLGTPWECLETLERLARHRFNGRIDAAAARDVGQLVKVALDFHRPPAPPRPTTKAGRKGLQEPDPDPDNGPNEPDPPEPDDEPTFEDRVFAARAAERAEAESRGRPG